MEDLAALAAFDLSAREVRATELAAVKPRQKLISRLGGHAAIAIGILVVLLSLVSHGPPPAGWLTPVIGVGALAVGFLLLRAGTRIPILVLDLLLVAVGGFLVLVGHYPGPLTPAIPGIYVVIGTIVFALRRWAVAIAHTVLMGASYAGVLIVGRTTFAPATRWVAVMAAVVTSGFFIRWLVGNVAGLAVAEHMAWAEAEAAGRELADVSQTKSTFLARMSHELRTPLNVVLGFADLLAEQLVGPLTIRQREYVADISGSARHLVDLVDDVLDLAKVETGGIHLATGPLDVRLALEDGLTMVRERAIASGVALTLDVPRGIGSIDADGRKIRQVIVNLLANAVKFTPRGGRVTVRAWHLGDTVRVSVHDTGVGIAPDDIERIFEEFKQSPGTAEGTGLGLPLARRFVEMHGGQLWARSTPGVGSTFQFELPVRQSADPAVAHAAGGEDNAEPDYSAFIQPGSLANRRLLARIGARLAGVAFVLCLIIAAITPMTTSARVVCLSLAGVAGVIALIGGRLEPRYQLGVEAFGSLGIAAITVITYFSGSLSSVVPLTYGWITMTTFALWPRRRAIAHILGVAVCYGVVLIVKSPPQGPALWLAILTVLGFNGEIVSFIADRLRKLVLAEQNAHREAERVRAQLAATSQHKSEFLANMSHELRTPLNAVIGFADLLYTGVVGPLNDKQREYVDDLRSAARHLLTVINDVLDLAKLEAGKMEISPELITLPALLERVVAVANPADADRRIDVAIDVSPEVTFVVADHHRLEQVLTGLVSNAVKFTPDGGRIELRALGDPAGDLYVSVSDTGIGIATDQRERIFEAFHQGNEVLDDHVQEGTGLGLSLARGLVQLHGGRIWVDSQRDRGSTFTIMLPAAVGSAPEPVLRGVP